jgi:transcriptional regulator with XRE-family HTH domain
MKHPFDVHVGAKLRQSRWMAGMTRQQLGRRLGVDVEDILEYETGESRIGPDHMRNIVAVTGMPAAFFFDGLGGALSQVA